MKVTVPTGKPRREKEESLFIAASHDIKLPPQLNSIFEPSSVP
jgi:hypothetical protein